VLENDTGPDDCNHAQFGAFILAAATSPLRGEIHGTHLLDMAPTLLELSGHEIPQAMQGRSLVSGSGTLSTPSENKAATDEQLVRDRLSGLGYI
jgi:hypothetical protein